MCETRADERGEIVRERLAQVVAIGALVAVLSVPSVASAGADHRNVQMLDACDPATFNAAVGPDTCVRKGGGVTFERFINQLLTKGQAPAWRFSPAQLKLDAGGTITAPNRGGELHTFSEVAEFGGGCIDVLNDLLGLAPVPECAGFPVGGVFAATVVPPGGSLTTGELDAGVHRFMCLIHPWMRTTVEAR
jgi:plastocyanin